MIRINPEESLQMINLKDRKERLKTKEPKYYIVRFAGVYLWSGTRTLPHVMLNNCDIENAFINN